MKPSNQPPPPTKPGNTLDEIKKLEQKREERRLNMEAMKKEKEERKIINQERGKNVDIDFEIMIDKNRFKDKMLQGHTPSTAAKVTRPLTAALSVRQEAPHLQEGRAERRNRCHQLRQPPDQDPRTQIPRRRDNQIH